MTDKIKICIFDTETNGLPNGNDYSNVNIIELGYIIMDLDYNIIKKYNSLIRGRFQIPEIITEITGITKEMTNKNGQYLDKVMIDFYKDIRDCEFIIAHNIRFDYNVIKKELKNIKYKFIYGDFCSKIQLCSLGIFRKELPKPIIPNHKLITIYQHLHNNLCKQKHRAIDDVLMIRSSFLKINNLNLQSYYFNKIVNIGKYKGKKTTYKDVLKNDIKYYNYMLRKIHKINPNKIKYLCRLF